MSLISNVRIFGVYLVLEIHICNYSYTRRLKIVCVNNKERFISQPGPREKAVGKMTQPFCHETPFRNSY